MPGCQIAKEEPTGGEATTHLAVQESSGSETIYHAGVSRGWESKSVESQMDAAREGRRAQPNVPPLTANEKAILVEREKLLMARTDVLHRLESSSHERYLELLRQALKELDAKIAKLLP